MKKYILLSLSALFGSVVMIGSTPAHAFEALWHGQFRINSYYQNANKDDVFTKGDDIQASRLRFRPTVDFKFDNGVRAHIQLNIGHINSNITNARFDVGSSPAVALRHGYISAPIPQYEDWTALAGLIPLSDKFGDTLFSSDWDFNPLTYALMGKVGEMSLRIGHANLSEGAESSHPADDVDAWIADLDTNMGLGVSFYALNGNTGGGFSGTATQSAAKTHEYYAGIRYAGKLEAVDFNAFAVYNWGKREFAALGTNPTERKNSGVALKAEAKVNAGAAKVGVMALYASGDKDYKDATKDDSSAFITPMSIAGTTGYWGYTGKLNVQGPTDTGVDTSFVNIDGGGYATADQNIGNGLTTVQVNVAFPIMPKLEGYAAAGWYTHNKAATGFKKYIGSDLYAQARYMMWENLSIEAGVDYAMLAKGHGDSVALGTVNQSKRTETLLFSRVQLEF
ncbi:MAG: hypothetical protein HY891_08290 [Deltaproteobacteria bacterium]|nr:hypothetical protein [Deltaproteobacteria bacterium]